MSDALRVTWMVHGGKRLVELAGGVFHGYPPALSAWPRLVFINGASDSREGFYLAFVGHPANGYLRTVVQRPVTAPGIILIVEIELSQLPSSTEPKDADGTARVTWMATGLP